MMKLWFVIILFLVVIKFRKLLLVVMYLLDILLFYNLDIKENVFVGVILIRFLNVLCFL